jgi:hypothetical protein
MTRRTRVPLNGIELITAGCLLLVIGLILFAVAH